VDVSEVESGPVTEFRMEVFIADQLVQFIVGDCGGDIRVAFLSFQFKVLSFAF
jgi:hypothetical protein